MMATTLNDVIPELRGPLVAKIRDGHLALAKDKTTVGT